MSTKQVASSSVSQNAGFFSAFFNKSNKVDATQPATQPGLPSALTQISITSSQHAAIKGEADSPNSPGAPVSKTTSSLSGITITSTSPTVVMSKAGETSPDSTPGSVSSMSLASNSSSRPKTPDDLSTATSVRASDAFMNAVAKKGQSATQAAKIGEWKERFGADLVDSILPQDVQNRLWDPIQTATYENFLSCKMKHPKAAGKLLTPYLTPSGLAHGIVDPWERANLYLEVFSLDKLIKHKDDLQAKLGAEKYDFLYKFLTNVQSFIGGIQEDSPDALRAFHEITSNHNRFVQVADEAFKQLEGSHQDIHRHAELWKRLENGILNFQDNVGIVRDLQAKLQRAKEFWGQLDLALGEYGYSKQELTSLVETCFSRFNQGHMPAQESDLKQIKMLLERRKIGADIAANLTPFLLNHGAIDGASLELAETKIFVNALKAQLALDSLLQKLQLLNQFYLHKERGHLETQLLNGLKNDEAYRSILEEVARVKKSGIESQKLSAYELEVAKNLRKKVDAHYSEIEKFAAGDADGSTLSESELKIAQSLKEKFEKELVVRGSTLWSPDELKRIKQEIIQKICPPQVVNQIKEQIRPMIIDSTLVDIGRYVAAFDGPDGEIDRLNKELELDAYKRKQKVNTVHSRDLIDPRGRGVNILFSNVMVFSMVAGIRKLRVSDSVRQDLLEDHLRALKAKLEVLETVISPESARALKKLESELADRNSPNEAVRIANALKELEEADAITLQLEKRNLGEQIQELRAFLHQPPKKPVDLLPFFNDYHVAPIGNVLYGAMEGKWAVVDLSGVSTKDREKIIAKLNPDFLKALAANARPYETLSFDLQLQPRPGKKNGPIKIFFEDPEKIKAIGNLDIGQRSRLILKELRSVKQISEGRGNEWPFKEFGDHARVIKPEAGKYGREGWNPNRQRTAAVDEKELVLKSRLIAADILEGRSGKIDWNTLHQMNAYFESVKQDDLAQLPGSYAGHENFIQALTLYGDIRQTLTDLIIERLPNESLQLEAEKRGSALHVAAFKIKGDIGALQRWSEAIGKFLAFVGTLPKEREKDYAFVEQFRQVKVAVDQFVKEFPDGAQSDETFIQQTLKGSGKIPGLEVRADVLSFAISPLADKLESLIFQRKLVRMVEQDRIAFNDPDKKYMFDKDVLSPLFLAISRLNSTFEGLIGDISDLTPLALSIRNTRSGFKGRLWKAMRNRTNMSKTNLSDKDAFEKWIHGENAFSAAQLSAMAKGLQPQPSAPLFISSSSSPSARQTVERPEEKKEDEDTEVVVSASSATDQAALAAAGLDLT